MTHPTEYTAIRMWHKETGSTEYCIETRQTKAAADGAPVDAIFWDAHTSTWFCVSDLKPTHPFRIKYEELVK